MYEGKSQKFALVICTKTTRFHILLVKIIYNVTNMFKNRIIIKKSIQVTVLSTYFESVDKTKDIPQFYY